MLKKFDVRTYSRVEFQDVTYKIREIVRESGVENGICVVYVPHTTAGIMINEHADPDVVTDIESQLDTMVPQHGHYQHGEGNSPAHIKAALTGSSVTLIIQYGEPALGTWQGVFFCEYDGPRNRSVMVRVIEDKG